MAIMLILHSMNSQEVCIIKNKQTRHRSEFFFTQSVHDILDRMPLPFLNKNTNQTFRKRCMTSILQHFSFTSFVLFFFFAILQINHRTKLSLNYYLAGIYFSGGYQFFYYWLFSAGFLAHLPFLSSTEIAFALLIGPCTYFYFHSITGAKKSVHVKAVFHFIPAVVSALIITIFNVIEPVAFVFNPEQIPLYPERDNSIINAIDFLSDVSMATYLFFTLKGLAIFFKEKKLQKEIRIILIFLFIFVCNALILVSASLFSSTILMAIALAGYAILPLYYIFFSFRYPDLSLQVIRESKRLRYKSTIKREGIPGDDVVTERLVHLMANEQLFKDPELTIKSLSEQLMLKPYQLSQILNKNFQQNFNTFVNSYRIEEAKRLLIESREKTILEVAFGVGFNSKSSFYNYFERVTGESPTTFKNNQKLRA